MNLETKITIYKFTPQVFTLTRESVFSLCILGQNVRGWGTFSLNMGRMPQNMMRCVLLGKVTDN
jgi:hypothetical protein